jgi:hypothetical protein
MESRCLAPACVILPAALLGSCSLFSGVEVRIDLPALPAQWQAAFPRVDCLLLVTAEDGSVETVLVPGWDSGANVRCLRESNTPVLAFPLTELDERDGSPGFLRPAGALYPGDIREDPGGDTLALSWEAGPAASVMLELALLGLRTSQFNAMRLREELLVVPDPWDVDLCAVAEKIAAGTFSVFDIDALPCRDVTLWPGQGSWALESPFRPATAADGSGRVLIAGLSVGRHLLATAAGRALVIQVADDETIGLPLSCAGALSRLHEPALEKDSSFQVGKTRAPAAGQEERHGHNQGKETLPRGSRPHRSVDQGRMEAPRGPGQAGQALLGIDRGE